MNASIMSNQSGMTCLQRIRRPWGHGMFWLFLRPDVSVYIQSRQNRLPVRSRAGNPQREQSPATNFPFPPEHTHRIPNYTVGDEPDDVGVNGADVTRLLRGVGNMPDSRCESRGNRLDRSQCFVDKSVVWSKAHRQFLARHEQADRGDKREDKLEALERQKPRGSI